MIGVLNTIQIIGALAFFIYGMKVMSEGIQKAAGVQFRRVLSMMTRNRYLGILTGLLVTAFVQSSSATTVMTVSFVNAGLMSLMESVGIIMGANIGTTITSWIISILGFQVKLHILSVPIFAIAVPMLFIRKSKIRFWGEFLIGFAILFLGLNFLQESIPAIQSDSKYLEVLANYSDSGWLSGLLFILIGAVITIIVQSSSAAMALTLVMSANGWIPLEVAATMVLGLNIGTTITAEVASLVGNVFAKRSARVHTLFNVLGACWMFLLLPFVLNIIDHFLQEIFYTNSAFVDNHNAPIALSAFHTIFNVLNTIIFLAFMPQLVRLASRTVKSRGEEDEIHRLNYINSLVSTSELSIIEVQKKLGHFGEITSRMSSFTQKLLFSIDSNESEDMLKKIDKYEAITNKIDMELSEYLVKVSKEEVAPKTSIRIIGLLSSCGELERIANIFFQMSKTIERKKEEKIWFNQHQRIELQTLFRLVDQAFININKYLLNSEIDTNLRQNGALIEQKINAQRDKMKLENKENINKEEYNVHSTLIYNNLFSSLERIGDHIYNIVDALSDEA